MLDNPYDRRARALVAVMTVLVPVLLTGPVIWSPWRLNPSPLVLLPRAIWMLVPAAWTLRILRLVARRHREGLPADEQTRLLFRAAMVVPVVGYLPMLWLR